jgi:hypothetical protein
MMQTPLWGTFCQWAMAPQRQMGENITFLSDVGQYMNNPSWQLLDRIVDTYIEANATQPVTIDNFDITKDLISIRRTPARRQGAPPADAFNAAYNEVMNMMEGAYIRFTQEYSG